MNQKINSVEFARSVVSGNPVAGETPEEKASNALELYLSAVKVVKDHNESLGESSVNVLK